MVLEGSVALENLILVDEADLRETKKDNSRPDHGSKGVGRLISGKHITRVATDPLHGGLGSTYYVDIRSNMTRKQNWNYHLV